MTPRVRTGQRVPVGEEVTLATDVYLPPGPGRWVVVLIRTPYGRVNQVDEALGWVGCGFGCVVQDVRGRWDSAGEWQPYADERQDGLATLRWLAVQPWCGQVVACGASYAAFAAWSAAVADVSGAGSGLVRAVISLVPAMGTRRARFAQDGILRLADHLGWWVTYGATTTHRGQLATRMIEQDPSMLRHLPVAAMAERFWVPLHCWWSAIQGGPDTPGPGELDDAELRRLRVPALHIGGWYDGFLAETERLFTVVGADVAPRPPRCLVLGPWRHNLGLGTGTRVGELDFGPRSRLPLGRLQVDWLRRVLSGADLHGEGCADQVRFFQTGDNRWREADRWPPSSRTVVWHASDDGLLADTGPETGGFEAYHYDPADPYPSRNGPVDRTDLQGRADAVRFTSPLLSQPLAIAGAPRVALFASTDAEQTDFVVRLMHGSADGRWLTISQGQVDSARAGSRPGIVTGFDIPLTPMSVLLPAGDRIQLEITSSDFPRLARSLNTGADRYRSARMVVAHQRICWGPATPTAVTLPVS